MSDETARLFNSAVGAAALAALDELGVIEELHRNGEVTIQPFCERHELHRPSATALLEVLHRVGVVELCHADGVARKGRLFEEAYRDKGYFLWLMRGYGRMLEGLGSLLRNENRYGDFYHRDGKYIALAGRDYGARFVDRHFLEVLDAEPFATAADIGCGSAERLIRLAKERPGFRGVGIDVSAGSVSVAREAVAAAGLEDRIAVVHDDVRRLEARPELAEVDVIFSFFIGHDLWPRRDCLQTLARLRTAFPRARRFLLADTYRAELAPEAEAPIFTLGFEATHAVMGQYVPTLKEWTDLFTDSAWSCVGQRALDIPFSTIFDLRARGGPA